MNTNDARIKKIIKRIEAMVLAVMIAATSLSYTVTATENSPEQELAAEQEEESEQQELPETEEVPGLENEIEEAPQTENEIEEPNVPVQDNANPEEEIESVAPLIEYSVETEADGYTIKLEAYEGVFPEGEELSISANKIEDQDILDAIDAKLSDVCEGEFKQISFDIKVLNASGEELQPDRSKYIENEDIIPIQLSIELANEEIEGEVEVFHFADDLSSMECLVTTVDGDEVTVEPEHFSVFTVLAAQDGTYYKGLTPPKGYRTYIEWMPNSTAGLRRLQKIYVYAEAGEQISFGSSSFSNLSKAEVEKSLADSFGSNFGGGTAKTAASIAVTLPYDGTVMQEKEGVNYQIYSSSTDPATVISAIQSSTSYSNTNIYLFKKDDIDVDDDSANISAQGTIYNWQQEALGVKTVTNPGGYTPISFTAPVTGVYTFRFFGTQYNDVKVAPKAKKTDTFPKKSLNYVGAWDITVTNAGNQIDGRTFTDALIWTIGANVSDSHVLEESVYALTKDGFEYKVDFNGLDPFGFVFYTNKRGLLVSSDDHEDGHYRSLARSVRSKRNQLDDLIEMGVHLNSKPTTDKDESYFITFEKADSKLLNHYTGKPNLADDSSIGTYKTSYTDFKFKGLNRTDTDIGTEGYGGYFSFNYNKSNEPSGKILPSTYEIIIDFTGNTLLEKEYGYAPGKHNEVILSNALVDGDNKIFWDGKDEHGNVVTGDASGIDYKVVSFNVKAGEVHFPLLDVENNPNGIKIEMQNNITGIDKSKIYYDNSDSDVYGQNIGDKQEKLTGVSSTAGAMAFKSNAGDCCAIDIWADYRVATPLDDKYSFKLYGLSNDNAFFTAKTEWQYYYTTMDGSKHFDATPWTNLPKTSDVVLQYRIVDKNTSEIGGVNTTSTDWQDNDTGAGKAWQNYSGPATVTLQITDTTTYKQDINLNPLVTASFENGSTAGADYNTVKIVSYRTEANNDPLTKVAHPIDASEGLCSFSGLPLHPKDGSGNYILSQFYQYRVVDKNRKNHPSYVTDEIFDRVAAVDIPEGAGHITKDIYLEETLDYQYKGAQEFNLEFDQLWNDSGMSTQWVTDHRPKAVQVAILYGVPKYEDLDENTEYDITTEKGYYGEDVEVVWRKIQQIDYLTIDENGINCKDSKGDDRTLSSLSLANKGYVSYFPVWKYMSNGDPYFYKIRPVSYSMDGTNFTPVEYWDAGHMIPKTVLPEFYGIDDSDTYAPDKHRVLFYEEDVDAAGTPGHKLYPRAVKLVDVPAKAEIKLTKADDSNNPILGKTTSYEITNKDGTNLMFTLNSEGEYIYQGLYGSAGLPAEATKTITTSTVDSIVHAKELPLHEYSIREVSAPEGYQLSSSTIDVIVPDFLSSSSDAGFKLYLCERTQKDSRIPHKKSSHDAPKDNLSGNEVSIENLITNTHRVVKVENITSDQNGLADNKDVNGEKLPKTGGLTGSFMAMILGLFMICFGIHMTKPVKRQ